MWSPLITFQEPVLSVCGQDANGILFKLKVPKLYEGASPVSVALKLAL